MLKSIQKLLHNNCLKKYGFGWLYRDFFLHFPILLTDDCSLKVNGDKEWYYLFCVLMQCYKGTHAWSSYLICANVGMRKFNGTFNNSEIISWGILCGENRSPQRFVTIRSVPYFILISSILSFRPLEITSTKSAHLIYFSLHIDIVPKVSWWPITNALWFLRYWLFILQLKLAYYHII